MRIITQFLLPAAVFLVAMSGVSLGQSNPQKTRVILDTDANNELDDQHAIAYLLFNGDVFDVEGITVNRTQTGGGVDQHLAEAQRVVRLCGLDSKIPVLRGADKSFDEIKGRLDRPDFDGAEAVNFIIDRAKAADSRRLVLLPVGKLTNIALALAKEPSIVPRVRIVWLGSNYPDPGEYNQVNDKPSLNYILDTGVAFEIALVRYGKPSGTDAVRATLPEIRRIMPGKGPQVSPPVTGRHGGQFTCFGDYSINLFENIKLYGDPPSRALFDMAAVAIVKNPAWATPVTIPAPILKDRRWVDRPDNQRKIILWENFDCKAIMADFYDRVTNYRLAQPGRAAQWEAVELTFTAGRDYANPYTEVDLHVEFSGPDNRTLRRPAFWDGGRTWRVRFAVPARGAWTWRSVASNTDDTGLHGRTGGLQVVAYRGDSRFLRHGLLRMSPGRRNVVHADGTPFLVVADTPWGLPFRGTVESVTAYARNRQERGFNTALLMSVQPDRRAEGPRDRNAVGGFDVAFEDLSKGHLNQLNVEYFRHLDTLISILVEHGIVPVYNPVFQGFGWKGQGTLGAHADPKEYARYTRYLIARYGAYPAMWLVSADGTGKERVTEPAGLEVQEWDAYGQPTGIHYSPFCDRKADWTDDPRFGFHENRSYHDAEWLDFQWCQTGHGGEHLPYKARRMHDYKPTKAVANGEPTYERIGRPDKATGWWQGHEAWLNLTAGGTMGVVYGAGGLWNWKIVADEPGWPNWANSQASWAEAIEFEGSRYVGYVGRALAGYGIADMTKLPEVGPQAVGKPGELYIVYLPEGGSTKLAGLSRELPCRWFNPRTGEFAGEGRAGPKSPSLTAPSEEPWVLLAGHVGVPPRPMAPHKRLPSGSKAGGYPIRFAPFPSVMVNDSFWQPILERNRTVTIPHVRKLCLTGGIGSRHGNEGFGDPYELPNLTAYTEVCAAVSFSMWNERMFRATGEAKFIDALERTLYNNFLAGVSLSGDRYFYACPPQSGYAVLRRAWKTGDEIELNLPMPVRRVAAHAAVKDLAGQVAVERGPIVYCVEGVDHGGRVLDLALPDDVRLDASFDAGFAGGVTVVRGQAVRGDQRVELRLIPHFAWANRGVTEMTVWMHRSNP